LVQVGKIAPGAYKVVCEYVKNLPMNDHPPFYPFSGIVINMNAVSTIHRDEKDEDWCALIIMQDGEGAELCLLEPGLVLTLKTGDLVLFPSKYISHFNLHFTGKRSSFVLHTDHGGATWVKDFNKWKGNMYFKS